MPSRDIDKQQEYGLLSKLAYDAESSTKDKKFQRHFAKWGMEDKWDVDEDLTNEDHVTFVDKQTGRAVIAFRGTNTSNFSDLMTDVGIAFGVQGLTSRFQEAVKVTQQASKKYGRQHVETTGHSLGGSQAMYCSKVTGVHSYSFNPGEGVDLSAGFGAVSQVLNRLVGNTEHGLMNKENTTVFSTGVDPISVMTDFRSNVDVRFVPPTQLNVHGMENFIHSTDPANEPQEPLQKRQKREEAQENGVGIDRTQLDLMRFQARQHPLSRPVFHEDDEYHPHQMRGMRTQLGMGANRLGHDINPMKVLQQNKINLFGPDVNPKETEERPFANDITHKQIQSVRNEDLQRRVVRQAAVAQQRTREGNAGGGITDLSRAYRRNELAFDRGTGDGDSQRHRTAEDHPGQLRLVRSGGPRESQGALLLAGHEYLHRPGDSAAEYHPTQSNGGGQRGEDAPMVCPTGATADGRTETEGTDEDEGLGDLTADV